MTNSSEFDLHFVNLNSSLGTDNYHESVTVKRVIGPILEYCVLTVIFYFLYEWNWSDSARQKHLKAFPCPKTFPFIGNGLDLLFKPTDFYKWSWNMCRTWGGDVVITWRLNFPMAWVSSFETARQLLANPKFVSKSKDIDMFWRQHGGNGLSSCPGHLHNERRKLLHPGYTRQAVDRSVYIFKEESIRLVEKLQPMAKSGKSFEILDMVMPCSFRIICRSTFGDSFMEDQSEEEALRQMHALHEISQKFTQRLMSPYLWLRNDFIYFHLTREGRKLCKTWKIIHDFGTMAIKRRREYRLAHETEELNGIPTSYLDMLLDFVEKGDLKEDAVLGELNNYIVAAYDTTSLAVAWALFALSLNDSSHQDKLFKEMQEIFGDVPTSELNITSADTKKMKYLELCVKESLRLFPTSPVLPRNATEDMPLKDGRVIPAGTDVYIMIDMIHRDPNLFESPNAFMPERFLKPNPAFMPFSLGVRNCIGQVYAMHQIKVQLALLLREYVWETMDKEETLPRVFQALMVPAEGIRFRITKRKK